MQEVALGWAIISGNKLLERVLNVLRLHGVFNVLRLNGDGGR